ncbi:MAG: TIGR03617 family F420-dependent LLM class oxidoreductase [Actinomycetota bacterium]
MPLKVDFYLPPTTGLSGVDAAAHRAAELGYDGFFTAETVHNPFLPLALAANADPHLILGTAIAVAFPRSPMITASIAWDLAAASSGRFILGLGTQVKAHIVRRFAGEWLPPGPRMRDYLLALRAIFATFQNSEPLKYEGEFYRLSLMTPFFNPGPIDHPDVPLAIAGVGPYMARLAGEMCQGFHVHPFHTVKYLDEVVLPKIREGADAAGRTMADIDLITTVFVVTGRDQAEIEQAMEPTKAQIAFYASTPDYSAVNELHGWDVSEQLRTMSRRGEWTEMAALITDEMVAEVAVVAPIDSLGAAITQRYGDRVQRVGYYTLLGQPWNDEEMKSLIASTKAPISA